MRHVGRAFATLVVAGAVLVAGGLVYHLNRHPRSLDALRSLRRDYHVLPRTWLVDCEMRFSRLDDTQLSSVTIGPRSAARTALTHFGSGRHARAVFESLGGYVNTNRIVHDWVGTTSWIPPVLPAYFVRISGVDVPSLGSRGGTTHHWNVIVNARTDRVVSATSFD